MDRKEAVREYKENPPAMGVWAVRNVAEGKVLLGASPNAAGRLNREKFALDFGNHPSRALQADWNRLGPDAFAFEVLDTLEVREAAVVRMRYGLDGAQPKTLDEIGRAFKLSRERIRQIESETMAKLRHPSRAQVLRDYLET